MADGAPDPLRFAVLTCVPDPEAAARWGDAFFAASFADSLRRLGHPTSVHHVFQWDQPAVAAADVVFHLRGKAAWRPAPAAKAPNLQRRVLWIISHPDDVGPEELAAHDLVAVASTSHAAVVRSSTTTPVVALLQATDLARFRPPGLAPAVAGGGIVVVANARWPYRRATRWLDELGWEYTVYGANWDRHPERHHWSGGFIANDVLPDLYATADIVVADQWGDMSARGFVANRLFDIAACGGFAIADAAPGIAEVFGDTVPTYATRSELDDLVGTWLPRPRDRAARAQRAMSIVRSGHGFDHRARQVLSALAGVA